MPSEALGNLSFWLILIGFNVAFFPMHILGLMGMPRRVYTYAAGMGWGGLNLLSTVGAYVLALGVGVFLLNLIVSARRGAVAGPNPWGASGLEWATASPPPAYNFGLTPVVEGRHPLWMTPDRLPVMTGLSLAHREVLLTTLSEARPDIRESSPPPSIWPFLSGIAISVLFIGSIFQEWFLIWASLPATICLIGWFWPRPSHSTLVAAPDDNIPGALA
jgi:cytochrome c oxidase subunit 1